MTSSNKGDKEQVIVHSVGSLEWPKCDNDEDGKQVVNESRCTIFCVGQGYLDYRKSLSRTETTSTSSESQESSSDSEENEKVGIKKSSKKKKEINLLDLSPEALEDISYYDILGGLPLHSTADDVRKAFHRASLKYHPDKLAEEKSKTKKDPVFLKVKEAFETLGNASKRKAYDSALDFDESIPPKDVSEEDFFHVYGSLFERNLRFTNELDPSSNNKNKKKKNKKKQSQSVSWLLGKDDTPMEEVHAFYDFWTHFESWRDFTLEATKKTKHDTDTAECRFEKRWMEKEIARLAKQFKKDEMSRIHTFVERAMASDPRLKRERVRLAREKKLLAVKRALEKEQEQRRQQQLEEEEELRQAQQQEEEKLKRDTERQKVQVQKKQLRKLKQSLRRITNAAYSPQTAKETTWSNLEDMNKDVELLCSSLSIKEMTNLLESMSAMSLTQNSDDAFLQTLAKDAPLDTVCTKASEVRQGNQRAITEERDAIRAQEEARQKAIQLKKQKVPWSKEELAVFVKGVKKYPAGKANRWETIATFFNHLCHSSNYTTHSRTKEECIEKFNQMTSSNALNFTENKKNDASNADEWDEDQDKQLQEALAKYRASMNKNDRW
eukprot:CAMPEP_0197833930 /NCGR_PEP_ID=MMETSP1437-20131217/20594_1 /TAXON_ID=49252 ORGANISM="Eucampia antarctica, Strain CCMP1452" /NCGR_SAMPLE_ID=MMETSP1437 /ASSEMBLY_ACC=CAM_ASM_001096 /LENGTH=608 /DNA_ID=CAMNT_0043438265 /DNA_START=37 /DNA_END=1860 /DNA_ORIENTATION=+